MGEFIFYYAKINKCIYVFHNGSLFFYSNKAECESNNDYLNSKYEYDPNDKNIYTHKKIDNYTFHLVNLQTNINFSRLSNK